MSDDLSTRRALEALLAKHPDDGYIRATRVIYAEPDGREKTTPAKWWTPFQRRFA